uniref:Major facilitator superfamily (MFS) profile domain-containing protein n=1 Tax=Auxenochlorella protothecoides TaxID=3075 RepID=A0A1D1ZMN6_AUXPR
MIFQSRATPVGLCTALISSKWVRVGHSGVAQRHMSRRVSSPTAGPMGDHAGGASVSGPRGAHSPSGSVSLGVGVAGMGALAFGYHLGVINGPLEAIASDLGFGGNATLQGLVVSSLLAFAAVGSLGGSGLADRLGRRRAFLLDAAPLIIGPLISSLATSPAFMIAGRAITGAGIGLSSALVPVYISEVAPPSQRGALGTLNQVLICAGILAALVLNVLVPTRNWRALFWVGALPAVLLGAGMLFLAPETPSWLGLSGQHALADETAHRLWGPGGEALLEADMAGHAKSDGGPKDRAQWGEVVANRGALTGAALFFLQQFSGINAIVYFSSSVFERAGFHSGTLASAAVGTVNVLGSLLAASVIERVGRRHLLSWSWVGMGASMLLMAAGMRLPALAHLGPYVAVLGTLAYILSFSLGVGPVPALLVPEITPVNLRGKAMAMAMGTHWICNFAIGQAFLLAVNAFSVPVLYTFFGVVCLIGAQFARGIKSSTQLPEDLPGTS